MLVLNGFNRTHKILAHGLLQNKINFQWKSRLPIISEPSPPIVGALAISPSNFDFLRSCAKNSLIGEPIETMEMYITRSFQGSLKRQNGYLNAASLGLTSLGFVLPLDHLDAAFPLVSDLPAASSYDKTLTICSDRIFRTDPILSRQQGYAQQFIVQIKGARPKSAFQFFDWPQIFGILPMGGDWYCVVWSQMSESPQAEDFFERALTKLLSQKEMALVAIKSVGPLLKISSYHAKKYFHQDTAELYLGESAHHLHPVAGQGLNLTLKDFRALIAAAPLRSPYQIGRAVERERFAENKAMTTFCSQIINPMSRTWLPIGLSLSSKSLFLSKMIAQMMQ